MSAGEAPTTQQRDDALPSQAAMGGLARGSMANLFGAFAMAASTLLVTILVTHALSRRSAGIFFSTTSLFMLATTIGQLGTNTGAIYFIVRARAEGRQERIHAYVRTALRPVVVTAVLMGVALFVFAHPLSEVINPGYADQSAEYLRILALFIPMAGIENVTLAATRGLGPMRPNVVVEQLGRPSLQLALIALALTVHNHSVLALGWAFCYLPAAVAAVWWWRRLSRRLPPSGHQEGLAREFWRFTAPRSLASVAQIAMQRLDIVLVGALSGPVAAAVYTASTRFLVVGQMGNRAISLAVQPRLGQALTMGDRVAAKHYYQVSTAWLMLVTWPLYLMFVVYGEQLLAVFGKGYDAGSHVLLLLALIMLLATACGMVTMVLNMGGKTSWNLYNVLLSMGVQFTIDIILIPRVGIIGAAIGWGAAIATGNLVPLTQVAMSIKVHPFGRSTLTAGLVALLCFGLVPGGVRLALGLSWLSIVVASLVGGAIYLVLLWVLREPLELNAFRDMRRRRRGTGAAAGAGAKTEPEPRPDPDLEP
ncbi:MAG: MATE family efflux transporter [Actinomycetales bacterium]